MYSKKRQQYILWEECQYIFSTTDNDHLNKLLEDIIKIINKNIELFEEVADLDFLRFILEMNISDFVVGTNGDDYKLRLKIYTAKSIMSVDEIWHILSQLVWDLTVPVTSKICLFCQCDNIVLLTDERKEHLYESCENCLVTTENSIKVMRPDIVYPADRKIISKYNYRSIINMNVIK